MTSLAALRPSPALIVALELIAPEPQTYAHLTPPVLESIDMLFEGNLLRGPGGGPRRDRVVLVAGNRLLRVTPVGSSGPVLFRELLNLVHLQGTLVWDGALVRGAVTLGDAAIHAGLAFGPGVSEAERLRDAVAEVPRIIVDPGLLRALEQEPRLRAPHHSVPEELEYVRDLLRLDRDAVWFLDYLRAFRAEIGEASKYAGYLETHASLVQRGLEACQRLDRASRVWTWQLRYHNLVVREQLKQAGGEGLDGLLVSPRGPLFFAFPRTSKGRPSGEERAEKGEND